jgi:hypothetical protein
LPLICSRQSNFEFEYFGKFEIKFENILGHELGSQAGSFDEKKTRGRKSCAFLVFSAFKNSASTISGYNAHYMGSNFCFWVYSTRIL